MANKAQRAESIFTAILNAVPTAAQKQQALDAMKATMPEGTTNAEAMAELVHQVRHFVIKLVKVNKASTAAQTAIQTEEAQVDIDFAEQQ